jgi:hypothetical protein
VFSLYAPGGSPHAVLTLAADALAWGQDTPSAGTASALAARAQTLAMTGDGAGARATLHELQTVFDGLDEATRGPAPTEWSWPETRLRHVQSYVHSHLGDLREAAAAQDAALAASTSRSSLGAAQVRLHQAMAVIVAGDPTAGARHVVDVLESLDPSFRRGYVRTTAVRALRVLPERATRLPEVRQARELLGASTT